MRSSAFLVVLAVVHRCNSGTSDQQSKLETRCQVLFNPQNAHIGCVMDWVTEPPVPQVLLLGELEPAGTHSVADASFLTEPRCWRVRNCYSIVSFQLRAAKMQQGACEPGMGESMQAVLIRLNFGDLPMFPSWLVPARGRVAEKKSYEISL